MTKQRVVNSVVHAVGVRFRTAVRSQRPTHFSRSLVIPVPPRVWSPPMPHTTRHTGDSPQSTASSSRWHQRMIRSLFLGWLVLLFLPLSTEAATTSTNRKGDKTRPSFDLLRGQDAIHSRDTDHVALSHLDFAPLADSVDAIQDSHLNFRQ